MTGLVINAITVYGLTDYLIDRSMTGFAVSQTNLSNQMVALQGSLDNVSAITNSQVAESRGALTREVGSLAAVMRDLNTNLGVRLEENSAQLASLNSTLAGVDKRLNDSIARQANFERVVMAQLLKSTPASVESEQQAMAFWVKQGVPNTLYNDIAFVNSANAVSAWAKIAGMTELR